MNKDIFQKTFIKCKSFGEIEIVINYLRGLFPDMDIDRGTNEALHRKDIYPAFPYVGITYNDHISAFSCYYKGIDSIDFDKLADLIEEYELDNIKFSDLKEGDIFRCVKGSTGNIWDGKEIRVMSRPDVEDERQTINLTNFRPNYFCDHEDANKVVVEVLDLDRQVFISRKSELKNR